MATKKGTKKETDQVSDENQEVKKSEIIHFEEWDVQVIVTKDGEGDNAKPTYRAEKLKLSRKCVKITEEEADALNHGRLTGGNTYVKMFFKSEE